MATKMITGVVERVLVRERENGADAFGNTHTRALQLNGQWFNFSGGTKPVWNVKIGDGFKVLGAGSEVAFKATTTVSKTNGKEYTNCSGLMVINLVEGENSPTAGKTSQTASSGTQGSYTPKPRNDAGIKLGHSVNGAMNFLITWGVEASNENIVSYGKKVHGATEKLQKEHKAANPEMSDYDAAASVGNAILNACKLVGTEQDFEQGVYEIAKDLLENVVKPLGEFIRSPKEDTKTPPVKTTRASPAKKATKAPPVVEPDEEEEEQLPF